MPIASETCGACGFDGGQYDLQDSLGTLRALAPMWRQTIEGVDGTILLARPAGQGWSVAEHTAHSADVMQAMGRLLHGLLTLDDLEVEAVPEEHAPDVSAGFDAALGRLTANLDRLHRRAVRAGGARDPQWRRTAILGGQQVDGAWVLRHAVHDGAHHLAAVGRALHQLGAGVPSQQGRVARLNVSDGGVPKRSVDVAAVGLRGLEGDRQGERKHHGRPLQALCLWSAEVIEALQAEGHPIEPGMAGENVTLSGIEWGSIRPGAHLRIGDVLAEVSAWAVPCKKNAGWFRDGDFRRMDHDRHPGWSRAYAWVREPGTIRTGDPVTVEP